MPVRDAPPAYNPPAPPTVIGLADLSLNPAAPLSTVQPSSNPVANAAIGLTPAIATNLATSAVTEPAVPLIAGALNVGIQWLKERSWFREGSWTVPVLIALSFGVALFVWYAMQHDMFKAITNGCGIIVNAHTNYMSANISGVGILRPTAPENKWQPRA